MWRAEETRKAINAALSLLAKDRLPWRRQEGGALPEVADLLSRYKAACEAADEAWRVEAASRPIDDEAWERELRRRREIEKRLRRQRKPR